MDRRTARALIVILFLAALLRIWGINFGLPYQFHQDEPIVVNHALAYGTGDLNPHFFIIPPLTSYILFFFYSIYYLVINILGYIKGTEAFAISFFKDPTPFYIIGRLAIGSMPSVLNVFFVYKLASEFFSKRAAIYSSVVMALAFLNVVNAHYIYTDNLLVLFTILSYLAMSRMMKNPAASNYILGSLFIGMAIATKYNAVLLVFPLFLAHLFSCRGKPLSIKILISAIMIPLFFMIFNPYALLDWRFFMLSITDRIMQGYIGWTHHIFYSLFEGLGAEAAILGFIGLLLVLRKNIKEGMLLLSFPAIFYLHLVFKSQHYSRYVLTLIPFLSIGLGFVFYDFLYDRFRTKSARLVVIGLSLVVLLPTFAKSVKADILFMKEDSRVIALKWIYENIPASEKIAVDHLFFSPPLRQTKEQLEDKRSILNKQPELERLKDKKLDLQIKAEGEEKVYTVYHIIEGNENAGQFLSFWPVVKNDLAALKAEGIKYAITSNMNMSGGMREFDGKISAACKVIARFSPYKDEKYRMPYDEVETTCIPITGRELSSRQRFGPCILVYKIQ